MPQQNAWLTQRLRKMTPGIQAGKTRRRKVQSVRNLSVTEAALKAEVTKKGWKLAHIGDDYVFAPSNYTIRPIV